MNLTHFFDHWKISENPFRGEEARHDPVFRRLNDVVNGGASGNGSTAGASARVPTTTHSDFEKIAGELDRPSTSIVFGEKGSGKTAIRMQLDDRVRKFNQTHGDRRCLLIAYDDLNPILDRFSERMSSERKSDPAKVFSRFRLVDHIDAILSIIVPRMVDTLLNERSDAGRDEPLDLGPEPRRAARRMEPTVRQDLLLLQALYDRSDRAAERTGRLRRTLRLNLPRSVAAWRLLMWIGWVVPVAAVVWGFFLADPAIRGGVLVQIGASILIAAYLFVLGKRLVWDRLAGFRLALRLRRQIRVLGRSDRSYAASLDQLDPTLRDPSMLPVSDSDDHRYAMLGRLRSVLKAFGFGSIIVIIDRIDEPTLISGEPERMRQVIWPLLNNKFLQQEGMGVKMLLPIELRHALFRESAAFFQEARLDKQNLIERLSWTGAMLYDLCNARLKACRPSDAEPINLIDLFTEDVTVRDIVDSLDQMHQPRDAFKLLYQCLTEHCSNVTEEEAQWRIPRLVLETVRKDQAERVRQLYRGVRPA